MKQWGWTVDFPTECHAICCSQLCVSGGDGQCGGGQNWRNDVPDTVPLAWLPVSASLDGDTLILTMQMCGSHDISWTMGLSPTAAAVYMLNGCWFPFLCDSHFLRGMTVF